MGHYEQIRIRILLLVEAIVTEKRKIFEKSKMSKFWRNVARDPLFLKVYIILTRV